MTVSSNRRSGWDRRQLDVDPPNAKERRRTIESRKLEIDEISISESEWLFYFGRPEITEAGAHKLR